MKCTCVILLACCCLTTLVFSQTPLTVADCQQLALQNSPLQQKKGLAAESSALQISNLKRNNLPKLSIGAQATYQSDVVTFPLSTPSGPLVEIPKDQYRFALDVSERLYDGGTDRILKQQRQLEAEITAVQVDAETFQLKELVADLFFKILLLQENIAILNNARDDLSQRQQQAEGAVAGGIALRTSVDQFRVQILKTEQQIQSLEADKGAMLDILSQWTGINARERNLVADLSFPGAAVPVVDVDNRPEARLFELQHRQLGLGQDALTLRKQPKVELFAQGGFGRPNPFNFFETALDPFALIGIRAAWAPIDWGNAKRESQVFELQKKSIAVQKQAFTQRFTASYLKDQSDHAKWRAQIQQDDAIITLQEDIVKRADAQVKNGVMTYAEYLSQLNLLTQARLNRKAHEVQAAQAWALWLSKL